MSESIVHEDGLCSRLEDHVEDRPPYVVVVDTVLNFRHGLGLRKQSSGDSKLIPVIAAVDDDRIGFKFTAMSDFQV